MDAGPSTSAAARVIQEELEEAKKAFAEAMDLRDDDPAGAVRLFFQALRTYVAYYGEMALESAPVYMRYGMALFEQAQLTQDYFGDKVQTAAAERDAALAGEADEASDMEDAEDEEPAKPTEAPTPADPAAEDKSKQPMATPETQMDDGEPTDDAEDMQVAWENLELARIIYEKHGGEATYASELGEIHKYAGDIFSEQEKFEEAIQEYSKCIASIASLPKEDKRRVAEVFFKQALALQFNDQPKDALTAITTARTKLTAHLGFLESQLGAAAPAPTATEAASSAFAAALASFGPPPPVPAAAAAAGGSAGSSAADPVAAAGGAEDAHAAAAHSSRLRRDIGDIKAIIEDVNDKVDELRAAIATHTSMKDALRSAMQSLADVEQLQGGSEEAGAGPSGAGAAAAAKPEAPQVQDLGVVGRGRRVAPVPMAAPAAAAAGGPAGSAGEPGDQPDKAAAGAAAANREACAAGASGASGAAAAGVGVGGDAGGREKAGCAGGAGKRRLEDLMGGGGQASSTIGFGGSRSNVMPASKEQQPDVKKVKAVSEGLAAGQQQVAVEGENKQQ